jgi:hypothetical protein
MSMQIVLISVDHTNPRKVCEKLENMVYPTFDALHSKLVEELGSNEDFLIFTISQFMDEVNDQILDNLENYFMTYVKIG